MKIDRLTSVGQIVAHDYRSASIFNSYGIDFCCNGNISLQKACEQHGIDTDEILLQINAATAMNANDKMSNYNDWPLDTLTEHIEKKHHKYVEQQSLEIIPLLEKISKVHGEKHPELYKIRTLFLEAVQELSKHMKKEELILFPFINKMVKALHGEIDMKKPPFGSIENPILQMEEDHDQEGGRFEKIKDLSNNYKTPKDGCNTYQITYAMLKEFEEDLHLHIHLENNILFPKSIALEKQLNFK